MRYSKNNTADAVDFFYTIPVLYECEIIDLQFYSCKIRIKQGKILKKMVFYQTDLCTFQSHSTSFFLKNTLSLDDA